MIFFKKMFRISRTAWNFLLTWWNWLQNFPENILETPYLKSSMSVNVQISIFFCNSCIILTRLQLGKSIFSIFLVGNWCTVDDFEKWKQVIFYYWSLWLHKVVTSLLSQALLLIQVATSYHKWYWDSRDRVCTSLLYQLRKKTSTN